MVQNTNTRNGETIMSPKRSQTALPRNAKKPGYFAKVGRTHIADAWFEPVKEKKQGPGRGNGFRRRKKAVKQYKLFAFIAKHLRGNVSSAARAFGLKQANMCKIIERGTLKRSRIDQIVKACQGIDPSVTEQDLFIPHQYVDVPVKFRKPKIHDPGIPIIKPVLTTTVTTVRDDPFSAALARISK